MVVWMAWWCLSASTLQVFVGSFIKSNLELELIFIRDWWGADFGRMYNDYTAKRTLYFALKKQINAIDPTYQFYWHIKYAGPLVFLIVVLCLIALKITWMFFVNRDYYNFKSLKATRINFFARSIQYKLDFLQWFNLNTEDQEKYSRIIFQLESFAEEPFWEYKSYNKFEKIKSELNLFQEGLRDKLDYKFLYIITEINIMIDNIVVKSKKR